MHSICEATEEHQINTENRVSILRNLNIKANNQAQECIRKLSKQRQGVCKFVSLKRPVKFDIIIIVVFPLFYFVMYIKIQY